MNSDKDIEMSQQYPREIVDESSTTRQEVDRQENSNNHKFNDKKWSCICWFFSIISMILGMFIFFMWAIPHNWYLGECRLIDHHIKQYGESAESYFDPYWRVSYKNINAPPYIVSSNDMSEEYKCNIRDNENRIHNGYHDDNRMFSFSYEDYFHDKKSAQKELDRFNINQTYPCYLYVGCGLSPSYLEPRQLYLVTAIIWKEDFSFFQKPNIPSLIISTIFFLLSLIILVILLARILDAFCIKNS